MEEEDLSKLSLDDKLEHKNWKARQMGYEELNKLFAGLEETDKQFMQYMDNLKKIVVDSNAAAQETGLNCVLTFANNSKLVSKMYRQLTPLIIEKCLVAAKAGTRQKALEILLSFVETEGPDHIVEDLMSFLENKQPKLVAASICSIFEIVFNFGIVDLNVKAILKSADKMFNHSDKNVRAEATRLLVEMYKHLKGAVLQFLTNLKPIQMKELQEQFESVANEVAVPIRTLKKYQSKVLKESADVIMEEVAQPIALTTAPVIDAYSLADPVNVLAKIPTNFYEDLASAKWKERKDALDALLLILNDAIKIEDGRYNELVSTLTKKIADANILVVVSAAQCLDKLGRGLKSSFAQYKSSIIPQCLERLKEKKQNVIDALQGCLDAVAQSTNLAGILESVVEFSNHKNPQVKAETVQWLNRTLSNCNSTPSKSETKTIFEVLLRLIDDGANEVREACFICLGTMKKIVGEKGSAVYLENVDKIKLARINECCDKSDANIKVTVAASSAPVKAKPSLPSAKPIVEKAKPALKATSIKAPTKVKPSGASKEIKYEMGDEEACSKMADAFDAEMLSGISDANWKTRLSSVELLCAKVEAMDLSAEMVIRFLLKSTAKESNFQVHAKVVNTFIALTSKESFHRGCAILIIPSLIEKLSDLKLKKDTSELLLLIAEKFSLEFLLSSIYEPIGKQKSPKILADGIKFISSAIIEFGGLKGANISALLDFIKCQLSNANPTVRANTIQLICTCKLYVGPEIRNLLMDTNASIMASIDGELAKIEGQVAPKASRMSKDDHSCSSTAVDVSIESAIEGEEEEDILPRTDISSLITHETLGNLSDANWKLRKEALDSILSILQSNRRIALVEGDLISALKARLSDSNKNLVIETLEIISLLAESTGKAFERNVKILLEGCIQVLVDNKPQSRAAALKCLDCLLASSSLDLFVNQAITSLASDSPNLKKELILWLAEHYNGTFINRKIQKNVQLESCALFTKIVACFEDRSVDVRKASQKFMGNVSEFFGSSVVKSWCNDAKVLASISPFLSTSTASSTSSTGSVAPTAGKVSSSLARPQSMLVKKTIETPKKIERKSMIAPSTSIEADKGQLVSVSNKRDKNEKERFKWQFEIVRKEIIDELKEEMLPYFSASLMKQLFSDDFKEIVMALTLLDDAIKNLSNVSDLILKYLAIRLAETNTTVAIKCLEFLEHFVALLESENYILVENEAAAFLPHFIAKLGDSKEIIKQKVHQITKLIPRIYPSSKLFTHLLDGLKSKNARTRTECLDEICYFIEQYGETVLVASKVVPIIALQVKDRDASVRSNALKCLAIIYNRIGDEELHQYLSNLTAKEMDLVEERLKRERGKEQVASRIAKPVKRATSIVTAEVKKDTSNKNDNVFSLDLDKLNLPTLSNPTENRRLSLFMKSSSSHLIDAIVNDISINDALTSMQAIQKLEGLLTTQPDQIVSNVNSIVSVHVKQLSIVLDVGGNDQHAISKCAPLAKSLLSSLLKIFSVKNFASTVNKETLKMTLHKFLHFLIDERIAEQLADGASIVKLLNVLMIKILDSSDKNACLGVLLVLLEQASMEIGNTTVKEESEMGKFAEIVMKSLWKMTRNLSNELIESDAFVKNLLVDIHLFLSSMPPFEWKRRVSSSILLADMPLRTIKALLHKLVAFHQERIFDLMELIEVPEKSFVSFYAKTMIEAEKKNENPLEKSLIMDENVVVVEQDEASLRAAITAIFRKIGNKEETHAGLNELYDFKKKHKESHAIVDSFLAASGDFFQGYIQRGLSHIAAERNELFPFVKDSPVETYKNKLTKLQQMFSSSSSTDNIQPIFTENPVSKITAIEEHGKEKNQVPPVAWESKPLPNSSDDSAAKTSVAMLKERLAKLKLQQQQQSSLQ